LIRRARSFPKSFFGDVSKSALLTSLLPISFVASFGTLVVAACFYPAGYDWRVRVISKLTSPRDNPQVYWLPALGIMAATLLALPFAGYVARRLHGVGQRVALLAGLGFAVGLGLTLLTVVVQLAQPIIGPRRLHNYLAYTSAGFFIGGMVCCCICALKDWLRAFGGRRSLPAALTFSWVTLTLLPVGCLACIGVLTLLGQHAGQTWAEEFRQSFRHTVLWRLAFWEWLGVVVAFAFAIGSVWLLPASTEERKGSNSSSTSNLDEAQVRDV